MFRLHNIQSWKYPFAMQENVSWTSQCNKKINTCIPSFLKKKKLQLKSSFNSEIYMSLKLISTTKMSFDKPILTYICHSHWLLPLWCHSNDLVTYGCHTKWLVWLRCHWNQWSHRCHSSEQYHFDSTWKSIFLKSNLPQSYLCCACL